MLSKYKNSIKILSFEIVSTKLKNNINFRLPQALKSKNTIVKYLYCFKPFMILGVKSKTTIILAFTLTTELLT